MSSGFNTFLCGLLRPTLNELLDRFARHALFEVQLLGVIYSLAAPHVLVTVDPPFPPLHGYNDHRECIFQDPDTHHDIFYDIRPGELILLDTVTGQTTVVDVECSHPEKRFVAAGYDSHRQQWIVAHNREDNPNYDIRFHDRQGRMIQSVGVARLDTYNKHPLRFHPVTHEILCEGFYSRDIYAVNIQSVQTRCWSIDYEDPSWWHPHPTEPMLLIVNYPRRQGGFRRYLSKWNVQGECLFRLELNPDSSVLWSPFFNGAMEWRSGEKAKLWDSTGAPRDIDLVVPAYRNYTTKFEWGGRVYVIHITGDVRVFEYTFLPLKPRK